jgi:tRNA-dihydrouridine synthase 2
MADGRYTSKEVAAPMVRASILPFREECLRFGADFVFTEELIDKKLMTSVPRLCPDGTVVFVTPKDESRVVQFLPHRKSATVLQLGTADGVLASKAAVTVLDYVSEVNVNMGCPKSFSVQGGMGASLLKKPELACDIVKTLRETLPVDIPVTCKIRLIGDISQPSQIIKNTTEFIQGLTSAGASAVTIHMRTTPMRPREPAVWTLFSDIHKVLPVHSIPILSNGDFFSRAKIDMFRSTTHELLADSGREWCDSVMIARGAMMNPSIFTSSPPPPETVMDDFLSACEKYNEPRSSTKWMLAQMIDGVNEFRGEPMKKIRERIHSAKSMQDLIDAVRGNPCPETKRMRIEPI